MAAAGHATAAATHARFQVEAALGFQGGIRHFEPASGAAEDRQVVDVGRAKALADAADDLERRRQSEQRTRRAGQGALPRVDEQRTRARVADERVRMEGAVAECRDSGAAAATRRSRPEERRQRSGSARRRRARPSLSRLAPVVSETSSRLAGDPVAVRVDAIGQQVPRPDRAGELDVGSERARLVEMPELDASAPRPRFAGSARPAADTTR